MKKKNFCGTAVKIFSLLLLSVSLPIFGGSDLEIVKGNKTGYVIAFADSPSPNLAYQYRAAAGLLKDLIRIRTGVTVPFVPEKSLKPGARAIYVGPGSAAKARNIDKKSWALNEYRMKADNGDIFLLGDDADQNPAKKGFHGLRTGSVKAVIEFAKKFAEADFLYPGRNGIFVPRKAGLTVPADLDITAVPYTLFGIGRGMEQYYSTANDLLTAPWYNCHSGHSHIPAIPPAKYLKAHPEYFAVVRGKRNGYPGIPQYCLSNPDVQKLIYQEVLDSLSRPGVMETQLGQTDGFHACECPECKKLFKDGIGEAIWKLHLDMAERLLKDRPGKSVRIMAYGPTVFPPKFTKVFPENVSVTLAAGQRLSEAYLKRWSACKVPRGFDVYLYNWGEYHTEGLTPTFSLKQAQAQTAMFRRYGINAIYFCGLTELPGLNLPVVTYYLRSLGGDPTSPEAFLKTFCEKCFGEKSAPFMEQFYTLLYSRIDLSGAAKEDYTRPDAQAIARSVFAPNVALLHRRYPDDVIGKLDSLLRDGEKNATAGKELLAHARQEFDYLKLTAGACNAFYAYHRNPGQKEFEQLANCIIGRKKYIDSLPSYLIRKTRFLRPQGIFFTIGHFPVEMVYQNGRLAAPLKAPFNWDVEYFMAKKMRPSGRVLKAGDPEWQEMLDVYCDRNNAYIKEHPVSVRCRVEGDKLITEMRLDNLEKGLRRGTTWIRLQKDAASPRYRLRFSTFGGPAIISRRVKPKTGEDYGDTYEDDPGLTKKYAVKCRLIEKAGEPPVSQVAIPLELFGGPAKPGEKRHIDFTQHLGKQTYTWEYNLNLLNWHHRYSGIGTLQF